MVKYVFKDKPLTLTGGRKASAQKIGEALDEIKQQTDGRFNSKSVLDAARDKKSYLYQFFEWRNSVAAEKYRQDQARTLVASIDIIETDKKGNDKGQMPAFISLIERDGRQYRTAAEVLDSAELQAIALKQAENDLRAYERRLKQFQDICDAIRRARELIAARRAKGKKKGDDDGAYA